MDHPGALTHALTHPEWEGSCPGTAGGYQPAGDREKACPCTRRLEDPGPLPRGSQNPAASPRSPAAVWTAPRVQTLRTIPSTLERPQGHRPHPPGVRGSPHRCADTDPVTRVRTRSGTGGEEALEGAGWRVGAGSLLSAGGLRSEPGDAGDAGDDRATGPAGVRRHGAGLVRVQPSWSLCASVSLPGTRGGRSSIKGIR